MNCPFLKNACTWFCGLQCELFKQTTLGYILLLAVAAAVLFGFAVFVVDPNIHSLWDGLWYAWVTMTHVGYGDVVPTSLLGRLLSSLLILIGLGVLALMTATLSTILMGRGLDKMESEESQILAEIQRLHARLDQLEANLSTSRKH